MEIYVKNQIHSNLLDSFTRKYNELLFIIAELERIYLSLDDELRATVAINDIYFELKNEIDDLALGLKRRKEFLSEAESEYHAAEKSIIRDVEENIPDRAFDSLRLSGGSSVSDSVFKSVSSVSNVHSIPFSYVPFGAFGGIQFKTDKITNQMYWGGTKPESVNRVGVKRDYDTYKNILLNVGHKNTRTEYMSVISEELSVEFPENLADAEMTQHGWFQTSGEDAADMAEGGYPLLVCDSDGFFGIALRSIDKNVLEVFNENGGSAIEVTPDMRFYVHR